MAARYRMFIVGVVVVLLAACTGVRDIRETEVTPIEDTTLVREMAFRDTGIGPDTSDGGYGPTYLVSFSVPQAWLGVVEVRNEVNTLVFEVVIDEFTRAPIFTVEALSEAQYWEQIGSYPGQYDNLKNSADTYFIYNLPIDAYYSGLPEEEFEEFASAVPGIVRSFSFDEVGPVYFGR
jgi:hypothetical protein